MRRIHPKLGTSSVLCMLTRRFVATHFHPKSLYESFATVALTAAHATTVMIESTNAEMIHFKRDSILYCVCTESVPSELGRRSVKRSAKHIQSFPFERARHRLFVLGLPSCRITAHDLMAPRRQAYHLPIQVMICMRSHVRLVENQSCCAPWG